MEIKQKISDLVTKQDYQSLKKILNSLNKNDLENVLNHFNSDMLLIFFIYKKNLFNLNNIKARHSFIKYLIKNTPSLHFEDNEGFSLMELFIKNKDNDLLDYILKLNPFIVNYISAKNKSLLDFCVLYSNKKALNIIFKNNPKSNVFGNYMLSESKDKLFINLSIEDDPNTKKEQDEILDKIFKKILIAFDKQENKNKLKT